MDMETKCEAETATPSPNTKSLEAVREAEEFFASGSKGRFANTEELFDDLNI